MKKYFQVKNQFLLYLISLFLKVVEETNFINLTNRQYCVILNPVDDKNKPQIGKKKLVKVV